MIVGRAPSTALWLALLPAIGAMAAGGVSLVNRSLGVPMTDPEHPHRLRVMTWNIGRIHLKWDSRAADSDLNHVAATIRAANPHIVALQELRDAGQLGRLVAALGPGWRGQIPHDRYDRRAALVLRLPARFVPLATSTGRTAQGALVKVHEGLSVAVASLHLDAFDPQRRLIQAEEMLGGLRRQGLPHLILAGDFNFDAAVAAQDTVDQDLYRFLSRDLIDAGRAAGPTTIISSRLDYVFYRSAAVVDASARVLADKRVKIMDHDPLVVELELR